MPPNWPFQGCPSWFETARRVARSWLEDGQLDAVSAALDTTEASPALPSLGRGMERLLRARLLAVQVEPGVAVAAREALDAFRVSSAPRWIARAIRVLEETGDASLDEVAEAGRIERDLGLAGPAA